MEWARGRITGRIEDRPENGKMSVNGTFTPEDGELQSFDSVFRIEVPESRSGSRPRSGDWIEVADVEVDYFMFELLPTLPSFNARVRHREPVRRSPATGDSYSEGEDSSSRMWSDPNKNFRRPSLDSRASSALTAFQSMSGAISSTVR